MAFTKNPTTKQQCAGCGKRIYSAKKPARCGDCWRAYNAPEAAFHRNIAVRGECWEWTGALFSNGYGHLQRVGRSILAHRLSWELYNGAPPPKELQVCHSCDNRKCVRPTHLFLGTCQDNTDDRYAKGRGNTGPRNGMSAAGRAARGYAPNFPFSR